MLYLIIYMLCYVAVSLGRIEHATAKEHTSTKGTAVEVGC
jgi:hypothetical protein